MLVGRLGAGRARPSLRRALCSSAPPIFLLSGSSCLPKSAGTGQPSQFGHFGEDAHFFGPSGMGVFDGVGGWARHGVDPRVYAQMLMEGCKADVEVKEETASKALSGSWERNDRLGACTACVAVLDGNTIDIVWIGDSQVMVVRDEEVVMMTHSMTHAFNYPFQLGFGSTDTPQDAMHTRVGLEVGDIVVCHGWPMGQHAPRRDHGLPQGPRAPPRIYAGI